VHISKKKDLLLVNIARAADLSMKPWIHSVLDTCSSKSEEKDADSDALDLILRVECRGPDGVRFELNDLDLEIYRSGDDLSLMISKVNPKEKFILWHGKHSMWMNGDTGISCEGPNYGEIIESFARRLRALFISEL